MKTKKPSGYWKKLENVIAGLESIKNKYNLKTIPSEPFLYQIRESTIAVATRIYHGGMRNIRKKMKETNLRKSGGYWKKLENRLNEAEKVIKDYGNIPDIVSLRNINSSLAEAIVKYDGGIRKFRKHYFHYVITIK